jgi:hypothetical protein
MQLGSTTKRWCLGVGFHRADLADVSGGFPVSPWSAAVIRDIVCCIYANLVRIDLIPDDARLPPYDVSPAPRAPVGAASGVLSSAKGSAAAKGRVWQKILRVGLPAVRKEFAPVGGALLVI